MSYSFELPEEDPICECKYDAIRDCMDREGCPFHCELNDEREPTEQLMIDRKPPASAAGRTTDDTDMTEALDPSQHPGIAGR